MYNIKGPSKIVAKTTTRRGISQKIDNYHKKKNIEGDDYNNEANTSPKPTFQKKSSPTHNRHKSISRPHEEVINYIYESWNSVCAELENENTDANGNKCQHSEPSVCYYEDGPFTVPDFKPFDLEAWWGRRLYAYVTNSVNRS
ncbi:unnamed protein product [Acanthoscelides obtectus]|uniref:Uncharacterized protein n=1 Tax=Acanthoscelides obtectus TaxID=200917 RepID=A0A9P0P3K6_ACAOB|nr:unnamed protein product [Acanthoscelides obtectus]CAK1654118.1 hypothetical protein AOBTE_LOCUS18457 [Acanthoscelides obtectus]